MTSLQVTPILREKTCLRSSTLYPICCGHLFCTTLIVEVQKRSFTGFILPWLVTYHQLALILSLLPSSPYRKISSRISTSLLEIALIFCNAG